MSDEDFTEGFVAATKYLVEAVDIRDRNGVVLLIEDDSRVFASRLLREGSGWIREAALARYKQETVARMRADDEEGARRWREAHTAGMARWRKGEPKPTPSTTRLGTVYGLLDGFERIKIGWTTNLAQRTRSLESATGRPLTLVASIPGTLQDERALHLRFAPFRQLGEWFAWGPEIQAWAAKVGP